MKKIIRTNNLQKALEDYDALKGQTVTYVSALPVSPNIRSQIYGIEETHTSTKNVDYKISELLSGCAEEVSTDHYKIKDEFTVSYEEVEIKAVEIISDAAMLYEDEDFETALPVPFELNVDYEFVVATSTKEVAFYVGEASSQTLHPVVKFAEITALNDRIDGIVEGMDSPEVGGANKYIASIKQEDGAVSAVEGNIDNTVTENSANLITSGAVDSYVSGLGLTNDGLNVANLVATNATITDLNVTNIVANKLVADSGDVNSANIENLIANGVAINSGSANLNDVNIDNATITNLIANGVAGNDGQVLGKVNGNIEWVSTGIDTNDFSVNHLTVNNSANIEDANVTNLISENLQVRASASVNGNNFTHKGFDVTSMTVISEDEYNNLSLSARGSAFYMTTPNGNMYFHGVKFAPQGMVHEYSANVSLPNMALGKSSLTTSTLTFTRGAVTNNFVNGGAYTGIKNITAFGESWDNSAPVGTQANDGNIITNATQGLYITNAAGMFNGCRNMTDCFITNPALRINAPENYDPMKYCTNMAFMFRYCRNFNQPITIPNSVRDMSYAFEDCTNFDQPVTIPNNCNAVGALGGTNFTQNLYVPNNANVTYLFAPPYYIGTIKMDTLTFESGFIASNVANVGFGRKVGEQTFCNNLVISGGKHIGRGILLYDEDVNSLVNGNSVTIQSVPTIGMVSSNIYLNCNMYEITIDKYDKPHFDFPLVNLGSYISGNVHIPSKYSVNTTNAPINIYGKFNDAPYLLTFSFDTQNEDEINSIITQYLTTGWDWSGNVWDYTRQAYTFVNIHLGIGHNFTGHIINDL